MVMAIAKIIVVRKSTSGTKFMNMKIGLNSYDEIRCSKMLNGNEGCI